MRIIDDLKLDFKDVLFVPHRSSLESRNDVSLIKSYTFLNSGQKYQGVPVIAANMDGVGTPKMALALAEYNMMTCLTKHYSVKQLLQAFNHFNYKMQADNICYSLGTSDEDMEKLQLFKAEGGSAKWLCIDVANGYSQKFIDTVARVRNENPNSVLIAGNVVTPDIVEALLFAGADLVKVGIGPGSVCTTRKLTGVGYPQLSAVMECADAAHGLGGHIVADGGCTCPGDVAKAFGANADFVMLGGMLAGHDEGDGKIVSRTYETNEVVSANIVIENSRCYANEIARMYGTETKQCVQFYGMSSDTAMNKHNGGVANYRASEGKTVEVPYRGSVTKTVQEILGGIRSTCTYVGARSLKELPKRTTFIRVSQQINNIFS
jgi:GMP reductase